MDSHDWVSWKGKSRCSRCLLPKGPHAASAACPGHAQRFTQLLAAAPGLGHKMLVADAVRPGGERTALAACLRYGAWSTIGRASGLLSACEPPTKSGRYVIQRVRKGLFPIADRRFAGSQLDGMVPLVALLRQEKDAEEEQ